MVAISIVEMDENTKVVQVYFKELMAVPVDDSDVAFLMRYGSTVKAMLVVHAKASNMGKLVNLRKRGAG
ncbi:MAG: hypothetical protein EON54_18435 [Alcaligenaceae bacterium]|nr:MAG: hypothetical protein EON54_18435 [Alcaligenaceae bacterium]